MLYEEIIEKVKIITAKETHVNINLISANTRFFNDLRIDVLDMLEIIIGIEFEFDIDIIDEITEDIDTIGDMATLIEEQIKKSESDEIWIKQ